jgi:hypothetical protein
MRLIVFVSAFFIGACSPPNGTGTGNPILPANGSAPTTGFPNSGSGVIFGEICTIITACNASVSNENCFDGIIELSGFAPELGIQTSPPPTTILILNMEAVGDLKSNPTVVDECTAKLRGLSCTDSKVMSAYNPSSTTPFAGTVGLLDPICVGVF